MFSDIGKRQILEERRYLLSLDETIGLTATQAKDYYDAIDSGAKTDRQEELCRIVERYAARLSAGCGGRAGCRSILLWLFAIG